MYIKNPFGLRNGKIVMIEDISNDERGLNCNCLCPNCKEPLIARMGDVYCHHFAHSGKGCDEVNAYLTGMYMVLNEHLSKQISIYLPPVIAGFPLSSDSYLTDSNVEKNVILLSESRDEDHEEVAHKEVERAVFDRSEIIYSSNGKPTTIVIYKQERSMAIRVLPPSTVCKDARTTRYKDLATLEIDLSGCEDLLRKSSKNEIFSYIEKNRTIFRWIYNPLISESYPKIIQRSKKYYEACQVRIKKDREEREALVKKREMLLPKYYQTAFRTTSLASRSTSHLVKHQTNYTSGYEEVKDLFTQQNNPIYDSSGNRWVKCEKCGKIMTDNDFACYGGRDHVNLGICRNCNHSNIG